MTNLFDVLDRSAVEMVWRMMGDQLNHRALQALEQQPELFDTLLAMRGIGKVELSRSTVMELVRIGLVAADDNGFYLSDIAEDCLDELIRQLKKSEDA